MNLIAFIRKWQNRVSYISPPEGPMCVTPADSDTLPVEIEDDFSRIDLTKTAKFTGSPHFTRTLKVLDRIAVHWTYDEQDVLNATDHNGKPLQKFSWEPITGEFLFIPVGQQHAVVAGTKPFDDYVRGIILRDQKKVTFRPYWPSWAQESVYSTFGPDDAETSFKAQDACETMLRQHGGSGWTFQFNINNVKLEEMTGVYRSRW